MVYTCFLCKWRSDKLPRRSYHKFPSNEELKQRWLYILGKSNISIGKRTSLCSIHFETDCFRYGLVNGKKILKDGSFPTLHLTNNNIKNQAIDSTHKINVQESVMENTLDMQHPIANDVEIRNLTSDYYSADNEMKPLIFDVDVSSSHIEVPIENCSSNESSKKSSIEGQFWKGENLRLKKKISTLQRAVKRLRNSKSKMKVQLTELKKSIHKYEALNKLMHSKLGFSPQALQQKLRSSKKRVALLHP